MLLKSKTKLPLTSKAGRFHTEPALLIASSSDPAPGPLDTLLFQLQMISAVWSYIWVGIGCVCP